MDQGWNRKVAVVTGGSSGIGLETVRLLPGEGCRVALWARHIDRLERVERALSEEFGADLLLARPAKMLDAGAMQQFANEVQARFGRVDALITNAGQGRVSPFRDTSDQDWRDELELKFFSQIHPIRAFQEMLWSVSGSFVGVNSLLAYQPEPHMVCTSAARVGAQNLLKSLAKRDCAGDWCEFRPVGRDHVRAMGSPL